MPTDKPRFTITVDPALMQEIEKYCKCSFSEILRVMIRRGLDAEQAEGKG